MPTVRTALAVALAALAVGAAACSSTAAPGAKLVVLDDGGSVGAKLPSSPIGKPFVYPIRSLCTVGTGKVTITEVQPEHPTGHLQISDWAVRRMSPTSPYRAASDNPGGIPGLVSQIPGFGHAAISGAPCAQAGSGVDYQMDVALANEAARSTATGFIISYRSNGVIKHAVSQYNVELCTARLCPDQNSSALRGS